MRLSAEKWDRLDLFLGKQVRIMLSKREAAGALVTGVAAEPPFAWVTVEFSAAEAG